MIEASLTRHRRGEDSPKSVALTRVRSNQTYSAAAQQDQDEDYSSEEEQEISKSQNQESAASSLTLQAEGLQGKHTMYRSDSEGHNDDREALLQKNHSQLADQEALRLCHTSLEGEQTSNNGLHEDLSPLGEGSTVSREESQSKKNWRLGYLCLSIVVIIWVISSFMVQSIESKLAAPFFLTYVGTGLFVILIPFSWATGSIGRIRHNDELGRRGDDLWNSQKASLRATIHGGLAMSGFWFLAILTYNASLQYTSVTSSTILSSTSSVFTLALSALFRIERITWMNALGVAACVLGSIFVGLADDNSNGESRETFLGDLASLLSAFFYACYTLVIGYCFPCGDESVDMALVFGIVGLTNIVLLTPVVVATHLTGLESLVGLTPGLFAFMLLQGFLDNVVSDYLWARAVLLTSPTVTTVGLSLTIPLSAICDIIFVGHIPTLLAGFGGVLVTMGFFAVTAKRGTTASTQPLDV